jgi:four helix bundle protein
LRKSSFRDLQVWQRGISLCEDVYESTSSFPSEERFGLTSQMRRAAVSIPSNIAEGHGRNTDAELARFAGIAIGSSLELETQLEICVRVGYLTPSDAEKLMDECQQIAKMLFGLCKTLRS